MEGATEAVKLIAQAIEKLKQVEDKEQINEVIDVLNKAIDKLVFTGSYSL